MRRMIRDPEPGGGGGGGGGGPVIPEPVPEPPDVPTPPRQPDEDRQIPDAPPPPPRHPSGRQIPEDPDTTFPDFPETPDPPGPPTYSNAPSERQISSPATILDQVVPMIYGSAKINGYCAGWNVSGNFLRMAFVFCFGEQAGIGSIKINSEAIGSATPWVISSNSYLGTGTPASRPSYMAWMATDYWNYMTKNFCCLTVNVNLIQAQTPGGFQVTAVPTGRKFASFQSPYTVSNHTNPAEVAYDILTSAEWKGLSSPADTGVGGTWEKLFDWWDDAMGDATKRFSFNGVLDTRDPDAALDTVLGSGFAQKYFSSDGVVKLWGEMKPPAISGTWTASASTFLNGSGGDATNELKYNEIIYAGDTPCIVVNVTGADTIIVDRAITISAELVRKTSSVWIKKDDWVKMPSGQEAETGSIPDTVRVRYTLPANWGSATYPEDLSPGDEKRVEVSVPGCDNASMARRISEMQKNIVEDQPFMWSGVAGGIASSLEPGDIFFFDDDGTFEFQPARVLPPIHQTRGGNVGMQFRQYSPDVVSENTQADPSVPATPSGYVSGNTPHFNSINAVNSSGVAYNFMRWNGTDMNVGSTGRVTVLDGISIRLPNNIALLALKNLSGTLQVVKCSGSDELVFGDGSTAFYLNASTDGIRIPEDVAFYASWAAGNRRIFEYDSVNHAVEIGSFIAGSPKTKIFGRPITLESNDGGIDIQGGYAMFKGLQSYNGTPTDATAFWTDTEWGMFKNTGTGQISLVYKDGSTIKQTDLPGGGGGSDTDAIHDNVANEITAITAKTTLVDADEFVLEDSGASFVKKAVTAANLKTYIGGGGPGSDTTAIHDNVANEITGITAVTGIAGLDEFVMEDQSNSFEKRAVTWTTMQSEMESDLGGPWLPLSAGSGEPLTGHLYINGYDQYFENAHGIALWNAAKSTAYNGLLLNALELRIGGSTALTGSWVASTIKLDCTTGIELEAPTVTLDGAVIATGATTFQSTIASSTAYLKCLDTFYISNGKYFGGENNAGGSVIYVAGVTSADHVELGTSPQITDLLGSEIRIQNSIAIKGERHTSGAWVDLLQINGTSQTQLGNDTYTTLIKSFSWITLDGSVYITGTAGLDVSGGGDINIENTGKLTIEDSGDSPLDMCWVSGTSRIFGNTTGTTWLEGSPLKLFTYGYSGTSDPSTTQWSTAGSWGIHKNTSSGKVYLVYRDGATVKAVELTASPFHLV